jgi:acyl-homoserine-lactone acylase
VTRAAVAAALLGAVAGPLGPALAAERPLRERVEILRDTWGVPHVRAEDEAAAAFGLGFAMAEDHAAEMGRRYLAARGESARHFGTEGLENDLMIARLSQRERARRALASLGRGFRGWLSGFTAGYNHYVAAHRAGLPPWVPIVEDADVLANALAGSVAATLRPPGELLRKYPAEGAAPARVPEPGEGDDGSNAFALAGARTTSGRPILLGNPHLRWSQLYWEAHVTVPGRLDFYGATLVGLPMLRAGFNDRIAYVQTNNAPDLEDIYALPLDASRPGHYRFAGRSLPLRQRTVATEVRREDGSLERVTRDFDESELGPIIHRDALRVFAVRSLALESVRHFEGFYELAHARSLREYQKVMGRGLFASSNFTYADADGNILYRWMARLPKRKRSADYALDVPGEKAYLWRGVHSSGDLPQILNPPHGYVQNANNPPWFTSLSDPLDPARFPDYVERGSLGLRPQVVLEALDGARRFSPDDVRDLKYTTRLLSAERSLPDLLAAARRVASPSPELASAIEVLEGWNREVRADSVGAALFVRFMELLGEKKRRVFAQDWDAARPGATPAGLADPDAAIPVLEEAVRSARERYGSERIAWGELNRFRLGALDLPGDGAQGALGAYRVMTYERAGDGRRVAGRASSERPLAGMGDAWVLLVHFSEPVSAWSVLAYGQTTRQDSPHASDQLTVFARHELRPAYFRAADVESHLERRYRP